MAKILARIALWFSYQAYIRSRHFSLNLYDAGVHLGAYIREE